MKKINLIGLLLVLLITLGCQKESQIGQTEVLKKNSDPLELYDQFARLLSKAVSKEPQLRQFIKQQALLQFNHDYDILYYNVKNSNVYGDKTFKDILKKHEEYPNQILSFENEIPLLTIYVPKISQSKFSAETWEADRDIPLVATSFMKKNGEIPLYYDGNEEISLKSNQIPGFPVLVIKSNERVLVRKDINLKSSSNNAYTFEFISPSFDNTIKTKSTTLLNDIPPIDASITNAFNLFGISIEKWQRDHIYYGLTDQIQSGKLKSNMVESIVSLKINRDALAKISDQTGDAKLIEHPNKEFYYDLNLTRPQLTDLIQKNAWTEGNYEFRFDVLINNKAGIGATRSLYLTVDPTDLFYIPVTVQTHPYGGGLNKALVVYSLTPNEARMWSETLKFNFPIITWDLQNNAPIWKISLYETDSQETFTTKENVTNEFATNFGASLEVNFGAKLGFNFGHSNKETFSREVTITRTAGEDDLGSVLVSFGDPIITNISGGNRAPRATLHEYSNSYFKIQMLPTKSY